MEKIDIINLVKDQRDFFNSNKTMSLAFRKEMLLKLKDAVIKHQDEIIKALHTDLGRSDCEAYFCDVGTVIIEINEALKELKKWNKPKRLYSGLLCFPSTKTLVYRKPYGVCLVISPFNFPFILSLGVLVATIASGNCAILKVSSKSVASSETLEKIISEIYPKEYISVVLGGHDVSDMLLEERFDKIFYTGSPQVAKHIMEAASKHLTPVALELGGENGNWAVITKDANLKDAARKIAFFKACNSGQICININQIAINKTVAKEFIELLKEEFKRQLGSDIVNNKDYAKMINHFAFSRAVETINKYQDRIVIGGKSDATLDKIEPTVIYPVGINEEIVMRELFAPILPIVEYDDEKLEEVLDIINNDREHPLAFYIFSSNKKWAKKTMERMQFGGGCINEVCVHFMVKGAPFNGVGHSGMGAYHGYYGFNEFTYPQTVLFGKTKGNLKLREHPYNDKKLKMIKKFEK